MVSQLQYDVIAILSTDMERFSNLDTLEPEGALTKDSTGGLGLYKKIESSNDKIIDDAKENIRAYEKDLETKLEKAEKQANRGVKVPFTGMPDRPKVGSAEKIPKDLSNYVSFLHPWMHELINQFVLMLMFLIMFVLTLIALRLQDIG